MTFIKSVRTVMFEKYATFSGRASRSEFWWFLLFSTLVYVPNVVMSLTVSDYVGLYSLVDAILTLIFFLPGLAVTVRRLHDTGKSGWWILSPLAVTVIAAIFAYTISLLIEIAGIYILVLVSTATMNLYVLYLLIKKSDRSSNEYGDSFL